MSGGGCWSRHCGPIDVYFKSHTWQKSKLSLQEHAHLCMYYQNIDILKDMHHELKTQSTYLLSKYPWGKSARWEYVCFQCTFGSSFCCIISQFSHSNIPQKRN